MQKTKKQLLGIAGLAAVGVMTAVACAMPSPNAAAVSGNAEDGHANGYECDDSQEGNECAKASLESGTPIQVHVVDPNSTVRTTFPQDGSILIDPDVSVSTSYNEVTQIDYYLIYKDRNGAVSRIDLASFTPTEESGVHTFTIYLAQYGYGYGEYTLHTNARGYNGKVVPEDIVTFDLSAVTASFEKPADNNDPVLKINSNSDVGKLLVSVYTKTGDPLFVDEEGNEVPIVVNREDIDPATGEVLVTLPFEKYGAPAGEYAVTITARDLTDARTISMVTVYTDYKPATPEVPNTGGILADLNITRVDYLLTGLIAFGLVAGFALYLVCRKSRR